jgi:hypothetical protein
MGTITSFQKRSPQSNSTWSSRDYTEVVNPSAFTIKAVKVEGADINQITIFFPRSNNKSQGIGLTMDAPEAIALGHALLGVALGNVDEMTGHFQTDKNTITT